MHQRASGEALEPVAGSGNSRFLVLGDMGEQLFLDGLLCDLLVHTHQQLLRLSVHVSHIHTALVVEQHIVALPRGVDAHVKLLFLNDKGRLKFHHA